jgi:hypothetical protein
MEEYAACSALSTANSGSRHNRCKNNTRRVGAARRWLRATTDQRRRLAMLVGNPALDEIGATKVRDILTATGARAAVDDMITDRYAQALRALQRVPCHPEGVVALRHLATRFSGTRQDAAGSGQLQRGHHRPPSRITSSTRGGANYLRSQRGTEG